MKTFLIKSALLILICIFPLSCKKYKEGPCISFRSIDNRIQGFWELEYLFINDADSTSRVKDQLCYSPINIGTTSKRYREGDWVMTSEDRNYKSVYGTWIIGGKKKDEISIWNRTDSACFISVGAFLRRGEYSWTITRLTKKQFWIKTTWNNQSTWAHFKKIE